MFFLLEKWSGTSVDADPYADAAGIATAIAAWREVFGLASAGEQVKPVHATHPSADDK
jgi:hypothetical protein